MSMNFLDWQGEQSVSNGGGISNSFRLGVMTSLSDGYAEVQFDGEDAVSKKKYKCAKHITTLSVSERVLCARIAGTYVVIAQI